MDINIPPKYECPVCEEGFDTLADKKKHIKKEHPVVNGK